MGDTSDHNLTPRKAPGWQSSFDLGKTYVGNADTIRHRMSRLREAIIHDIADQMHCSEDQATALVDAHLIGMRKPPAGCEALAVSSDAVPLLGLTQRSDVPPPKPEGWRSAVSLARDHHACAVRLNRLLQETHDALVQDMIATGYSNSDAVALVENNLIGQKTPFRGRAALYASPQAVRILEEDGCFFSTRSRHR
jgi:hypothetical protein